MRIKRFFFTAVFIICIAFVTTSCSQEDEMDQAGSLGNGYNSTVATTSFIEQTNDSIIYTYTIAE